MVAIPELSVQDNGALPGYWMVVPADISVDHVLYEFYVFVNAPGGSVYKTGKLQLVVGCPQTIFSATNGATVTKNIEVLT